MTFTEQILHKDAPKPVPVNPFNVTGLVLGIGEVVLSGAIIVTLLYLIFPFRF
jgi:hypothetical protein